MKNISEIIKDEYLNQDYYNPTYIFHGSPFLIEEALIPNKGNDSIGNESNNQIALYGSSIFLGAVPYAIITNNISCSVGYYPWDISAVIYEGIIKENQEGYIYVFKSNKFKQCDETCQYVCHEAIQPIEIIKVKYKDYKQLFIDAYDCTDDYARIKRR